MGVSLSEFLGIAVPYLGDYEPDGRSVAAPAIGKPPQTTHRFCLRERGQTRRSSQRQRPTRVACGSEDEQHWTVMPAKPTRVALNADGTEKIVELLQKVAMARSARRAVTGDGVCIGLTYKEHAFIHPKTSRNL